MNEHESAFIDRFNEAIEGCQAFVYITRDSDLQRQAGGTLDELLALIAAEKGDAVRGGAEKYANILLGCQSLATALKAEIEMSLLLKEGRPEEAWNRLVDAQYALSDAIRADAGFGNLASQLDRLLAVETLVFPPQLFLSSGMIVKSQICTICGQEYEDCEHVKGRPYMGEFCRVRLIPSEVDHIAIVDKPANKRCRIFKFGVEGGYRNCMTWAIEPATEKDGPPLAVDGLNAQCIVATASTFVEDAPR
jgi:hypothetical protein